jgi:transcriptional regulator GlxA family with amidase domain
MSFAAQANGVSQYYHAMVCDARVSFILELLSDSRRQSLDLDQLSISCNLSPSRVRTTPHRHFKNIKLARAMDLSQHSFYPVKQIASFVGFSDLSHFVRDYKLRFGKTPTETRRQYLCGDP